MSRYSLGNFTAEVEEAVTRCWYQQAGVWDCPCGHCRNFVELARTGQLPQVMAVPLKRLGIPPEKATYVCEAYHENGELLYEVGYRLAGIILTEPKAEQQSGEPEAACHLERSIPFEAPDFPEPAFELNFWVKLPWILDEPINGREENI